MKQPVPAQPQSSSGSPLGRSLVPIRSQLISSEPERVTRSPELNPAETAIAPSGHSFATLALHSNGKARPHELSPTWIQPKLTIGAPGDRYEQEADLVAKQVVQRLNAPQVEQTPTEGNVQRKNEDEDEEELQRQPLQRQGDEIGGGDASPDLTSAINRARGSGQPLAAGLRQSMGQAMGADFSGVRVHADAQADQLNRSIQAKAFTTGQDVFFRQGVYQPGSRGGQELIAHELTHVVQQNNHLVQRSRDLRPLPINTSLSQIMIQRLPVNFSTVKPLIEGYRLTYADKAYKAFVIQNASKIQTILGHKLLLESSYKSIRTILENAYKHAANSIEAKREYFQGADLSTWGQVETYNTDEKKEELMGAFVDTSTYSTTVKAANEVFTADLTRLEKLTPEISEIYQSVEKDLQEESIGETLSAKLKKKLEVLEKPTAAAAAGMPTALKTKLGEVMGEVNSLKAAVTLDVGELMKNVKTKPMTKVIKTPEDAKNAVHELISEEHAVKQFRESQGKIKEKVELFLAFFADANSEDAALSEDTAALPADPPEIHQYYLNHPKYISQPITKTIWSDYKATVLSLWTPYREVWLDTLHATHSSWVITALKKLQKTIPFNWQTNLLNDVQPPGTLEKLRSALIALTSVSKKDFLSRYEIDKIGSNMGYREVRAPQSNNVLAAKTGTAADRIGYVINITTIPSAPSPQAIAQKYYDQGFDDQHQSKERIALVVGVNKFRSLDNTSDEKVRTHANENDFNHFSLDSFGFTWDFNWKAKATPDKDGFEGAFQAFKEQDDPTQQAALNYEKENIKIQNRLPYAQFKEKVTAHPQTQAMVKILKSYNQYVYIHLGDSDAVSLKAPEEQPTTSTGETLKGPLKTATGAKPAAIFSRYDLALGAKPAKPFMAIGGYEFRTEGTSGTKEEQQGKGDLDQANLEHLLTYLANQLDAAVRIAIAKIDSRAVYPTEPNLVFMAAGPGYDMYSDLDLFDPSGNLKVEGSLFGEGAREGRKLQNNLLDARTKKGITNNEILYDPRLSIATGSDRFRLEGTAQADHRPAIDPKTKNSNPTYEKRRKNTIRGKVGSARKEAFKSQIIEDIANQPQTFVERSLNFEINEIFTAKIQKFQLKKFAHRISNVLSQKYISKDKFSAAEIERARIGETKPQITELEKIIKSVEDTLNSADLNDFWIEMNRVIDKLYDTGYTSD